MDMSVKLNLSYPAARPTEQVAEKPVSDVAVSRPEEGKRLSDGNKPSAEIDAEQVRKCCCRDRKISEQR